MALDRRLYVWDELRESAEAMAMMDRLLLLTRRALERYADLSEAELRAMLATMNREGSDFGHRFCYEAFLGGLCHVQFSYLPDEDCFILMPMCSAFPSPRPIDRVAVRINGVMCTRAPEAVSAMHRQSLVNGTSRLHLGDAPPIPEGVPPHGCAYCLRRDHHLHHCTCGLVRYCGRTCQRAHWRLGHKALCRWAMSCMAAFGPSQVME